MKKIVFTIILLVMFYLPVAAPLVHGNNPFTTQNQTEQKGSFYSGSEIMSKVFTRIILWQQYLKTKMTNLVRQADKTGSVKPILFLILTAFVYGVVHAAGPGHGKAIALSYVMTQKPSYLKGLIFSNFIALFHGVSGIIFVIFVKIIINTGVMGSLDNVTNLTQIVSYTIITFIGAAIACFSFYKIVRQRKDRVDTLRKQLNPVLAAAVIGCIPCPGVIIIMLFALSMDLLILSIALGIAISFGMAVTVSTVVLFAISGKFALVAIDGKRKNRAVDFEVAVELFAGIILMVLGSLFLGANI